MAGPGLGHRTPALSVVMRLQNPWVTSFPEQRELGADSVRDSLPNHCGVSLAELTPRLTPPVLRRWDLSGCPDPLCSPLLWVSILVSLFLLLKFMMDCTRGSGSWILVLALSFNVM